MVKGHSRVTKGRCMISSASWGLVSQTFGLGKNACFHLEFAWAESRNVGIRPKHLIYPSTAYWLRSGTGVLDLTWSRVWGTWGGRENLILCNIAIHYHAVMRLFSKGEVMITEGESRPQNSISIFQNFPVPWQSKWQQKLKQHFPIFHSLIPHNFSLYLQWDYFFAFLVLIQHSTSNGLLAERKACLFSPYLRVHPSAGLHPGISDACSHHYSII